MKIALVSGTNRPGSNTRKLVGYIDRFFKNETSASVCLVDLAELPQEIFLPSAYQTKPLSFQKFIDAILEADGILCVIPEYNGGAPGVFKYFIDMLPFPKSLQKIPTTFVGIGLGRFGALRACEQMQQIFEYRNAYIYPDRVFIPFIDKELDENGGLKNPKTLDLLHSQIKGFLEFTKKFKA